MSALTCVALMATVFVASQPDEATSRPRPGVRLGPLETMCVQLPDATPGDVC